MARLSLLTLPLSKRPIAGDRHLRWPARATVLLASVLSVTNGLLRASEVAGSSGRVIVFTAWPGYPGPVDGAEEGAPCSQDELAVD